jgi:hypothetical protein
MENKPTLEERVTHLESQLKASIEYSEYISESLSKQVEYSNYLAETLDQHMSYIEFINEHGIFVKYLDYIKLKELSVEEKIRVIREKKIDEII